MKYKESRRGLPDYLRRRQGWFETIMDRDYPEWTVSEDCILSATRVHDGVEYQALEGDDGDWWVGAYQLPDMEEVPGSVHEGGLRGFVAVQRWFRELSGAER